MSTPMAGKILANASAEDRSGTDFYPTPPDATQALLDFLNLPPTVIWEPACGEGHMARVFEQDGHAVLATDLHDQGYGRGGINFLEVPCAPVEWVITNPPFKHAELFIRKCMEHKKKFAMLLKSQFWHSSRRRTLFDMHPPTHVLPLTWRPDFHFGAKGGSPTMEVLWTVWGTEPAEHTNYRPLVRKIIPKSC